MKHVKLIIFKIGNIFYKYAFFLYRPLYFLYKRISDKDTIAYLQETIKSDMTVLDIGANIGFYSILFSQLVGKNGRVIAFEPDENNFKHLKQLTDRLKNVTAIRAAVGERNEKIKLYYSNDLNIDHQTYDNGQNRSYKEIDGIFIDGYFKNNETVDFVKIDIQGYDYYAIKGMRQTIERSKGVVILGEFWPYGLKSAGIRASEYIELLESLDLTVNFSQKSITKENVDSFASNWFYYTDFIATK